MNFRDDERIDDIPGTKYRIIQSKNKFSYGTDAIFLSEFVKKGKKVVDLGTGTGIIPIRMMGRKEYKKIYGIEIQKDMAEMAKRSVKMNGLEDYIEIMNMDIKDIENKFDKNSIDIVVTNPPYIKKGDGIINEKENLAISRHEILIDIEDIIKSAEYLLDVLGKLFMVHRPDRLVDIFYYMRKYKIEPKKLQFVKPSIGKVANLVLIEAVKHGKPELKIAKDLIVYDEKGEYTKEIIELYYGGEISG